MIIDTFQLKLTHKVFSNLVVFRVYDPENYRLVQTNEGHTDSVRTIMHITERNQVCLLYYFIYF